MWISSKTSGEAKPPIVNNTAAEERQLMHRSFELKVGHSNFLCALDSAHRIHIRTQRSVGNNNKGRDW